MEDILNRWVACEKCEAAFLCPIDPSACAEFEGTVSITRVHRDTARAISRWLCARDVAATVAGWAVDVTQYLGGMPANMASLRPIQYLSEIKVTALLI